MDDKDLRDRIKGLDPMHPGLSVRPVTDELSRKQVEEIVEGKDQASTGRRRRVWYAGAAAMIALVIGGFALVAGTQPQTEPLRLSLPPSDAMASCIALSADILAESPVALEGTVASVEGDLVTLDVDQWFRGGDASQVELVAPQGLQALIGGIEFETGQTYLITAGDGTVNYCGFSDLASPELRALYEEAFS